MRDVVAKLHYLHAISLKPLIFANQFLAFLGTDAHLPDVPQISVSAVFYPKDIVSKIDLPGLKLPAVRRMRTGNEFAFLVCYGYSG